MINQSTSFLAGKFPKFLIQEKKTLSLQMKFYVLLLHVQQDMYKKMQLHVTYTKNKHCVF